MAAAPKNGIEPAFDDILRAYSEKIEAIELSVPALDRREAEDKPKPIEFPPSTDHIFAIRLEPHPSPSLDSPKQAALHSPAPAQGPRPLSPAAKETRKAEGEDFPAPLLLEKPPRPEPAALASLEIAPAEPPREEEPPASSSDALPRATMLRARSAALAIIILAAAVVGAMLLGQILHSPVRIFPLPHPDSLGVAVDRGEIFSLSPQEGLISALSSASGDPAGSWAFPNPLAGGLATGEGSWWSSDPRRGFIYRHGASPRFSVRRSYPTKNRHPSVIYYRHGSLWAWDAGKHLLYRYLVAHVLTGVVLLPVNEYRLPGISPAGFYAPSTAEIWALNSLDKKIYRYRISGSRAEIESAVDLRPWLGEEASVSGFGAGQSFFWVATERPGRLYRIERRVAERE